MELTPDREQAREMYRQQISQYIARQLVAQQIERPMLDIGYDDQIVS